MRAAIPLTYQQRESTRWPSNGLSWMFLIAGLVALGYAGSQALDAYTFQTLEQDKFEARMGAPPEAVLAPEAVPATGLVVTRATPMGNVIGEIELPRVGLKAIVVQGDSEKLLNRAVGHLTDSALPGEIGNVALAGHRDGLFRPLRKVLPGDRITLRTAEREFHYEVIWAAVVPPAVVSVLQPTRERSLTLVTCFPFYYVGAAPERFVVRAREVESNP